MNSQSRLGPPRDFVGYGRRPPRVTWPGGRLVAVSVVEGHGDPVMPCGRCRQLLWEHGGPSMLLETARGVRPMSEVLPDAFGPHDLER